MILQGICYDKKSSFLKGPALAPPIIRTTWHNGSANYFAENGVDTNTSLVVDKGDFAISDYFEIEKITAGHLAQNNNILTLGGDHSITYPILKAFHKIYPKLTILHIDAHTDLYQEYEGDPYSHACPFARIMEEKLASRLVQLGIRTLNPHQREQAEKFGVEIMEMKDFARKEMPRLEGPVYISLDMDAFDPAFAPGVSHQEPGGLTSRQVIDIIQNLKTNVVGADIVEFNPTRDVNGITAALAAKMMKEVIGQMLDV